jgi:hypothetical protein
VAAKHVQVFGFAVDKGPTFRGYDWSLLTTSAWKTDPELIELAQQHGAKVELNAGDVRSVMGDPVKRQDWVSNRILSQTLEPQYQLQLETHKAEQLDTPEAWLQRCIIIINTHHLPCSVILSDWLEFAVPTASSVGGMSGGLLCQVAGTMVQMVKTGATGVNFDLEMPLKVRGLGLLGTHTQQLRCQEA